MQSLAFKQFRQLISSVNLPLFEGFEKDIFFQPSPHANLKGHGSNTTATSKIEPCVTLYLVTYEVTMCMGILERKTILLVAKARAF